MNYNSIVLAGRVAGEVEEKQSKNGKSIANFTLAVSERSSNGEKTNFLKCVAFGKTAETIATYVVKGQVLLVDGSLSINEYQDQMGNQKSYPQIIVRSFQFGQRPKSMEQPPQRKGPTPATLEELTDDDLVF